MILELEDLKIQAALGIKITTFPTRKVFRSISHLKKDKSFREIVDTLENIPGVDMCSSQLLTGIEWAIYKCLQAIAEHKYCPSDIRNELIKKYFIGYCCAVHKEFNYKY